MFFRVSWFSCLSHGKKPPAIQFGTGQCPDMSYILAPRFSSVFSPCFLLSSVIVVWMHLSSLSTRTNSSLIPVQLTPTTFCGFTLPSLRAFLTAVQTRLQASSGFHCLRSHGLLELRTILPSESTKKAFAPPEPASMTSRSPSSDNACPYPNTALLAT